MLTLALLLLTPGQSCPPPPHLMPFFPGPVIVRPAEPVQDFGVSAGRIRSGPRYRLSGNIVGRDEALAALGTPRGNGVEAPPLPDRSRQGSVTAAGSDAERKAMLQALPADLSRSWKVQDYPEGHWALRPGFKAGARLYVQDSAGRVLHRQDDALITPELCAALREPDKSYDPANDPDRRRGPAGKGPAGAALVAALMAATALGTARKGG